LQEHVKDISLKAPFDHMIPLVEFSMATPLNRGAGGLTTGTVNPGVIWSGQYFQVGVGAVIPINPTQETTRESSLNFISTSMTSSPKFFVNLC
jgi:hypothetical protein